MENYKFFILILDLKPIPSVIPLKFCYHVQYKKTRMVGLTYSMKVWNG